MTDMPTGWIEATIDEHRSSAPNAITDGPFGSNLKTSHYTNDGPKVVRLGNIGAGNYLGGTKRVFLKSTSTIFASTRLCRAT